MRVFLTGGTGLIGSHVAGRRRARHGRTTWRSTIRFTQEAFLLGMARALGVSPRLVHVPAGLVRAGAMLGERLDITMPGAGDLSLSRFAPGARGQPLSLAPHPAGAGLGPGLRARRGARPDRRLARERAQRTQP